MANNHMGDLEHGLKIIRDFKEITDDFPQFEFSIKLQHRSDSFIHPKHLHRKDHKYIKRFTETKLSPPDFKRLKEAVHSAGFVSMCTPWDEQSVDLMEELGFQIIKIASCSFTDWPLLEKVVKTNRPVIISTAGASIDDIDRVVAFLMHRDKDFTLMHCVGEYPCLPESLELNQIDLFHQRYPKVKIGYSTHECPNNFESIQIAIAKGAEAFEKHIAVETQRYPINAYSATPPQVRKWLEAAANAYKMCGVVKRRKNISEKELADLKPLFRGAFANSTIKKGEKVSLQNTFMAMPNTDGQLVARQISKYTEFYADRDFEQSEPIMLDGLITKELRVKVTEIINKLRKMIKSNNIALPPFVNLEISHHYGIDKFDSWGAIVISVINRAYSKLLLVMFPGQAYPRHRHIQKDETYHLLYGDLIVEIEGRETILKVGDVLPVNRGAVHSFKTHSGAIIEEVATTYVKGDSIYEDDSINTNVSRKLSLTFWPEWLND